jgi:phosphohistidine phosphatase
MRLFLMRHALAALSGPWSDADRPLTPDGERQAVESAQGLACLQLGVQHIQCSPAERCRRTAEIVAEELGLSADQVTVSDALSIGTSLPRTLHELRGRKEANLLWVGHQPVLERLTSRLLLGEAVLPFQLLPAACLGMHCRFRNEEVRASLLWFLRSDELSLLRPAGAARNG